MGKASPVMDALNRAFVVIIVVAMAIMMLPIAVLLYFADTLLGKNKC
jgi:hypothetical protein